MKTTIAQRFDQAAHQYDQYAGLQKEVAERALTLFDTHARSKSMEICVDLGCGTATAGKVLSALAKTTIGLDISQEMLGQAQRKFADTQCHLDDSICKENTKKRQCFVNADAEKLPFKHASIDAFYSSMALQWCTKPQQLMQEVKRTLKPNGVAIFAILVEGSFSFLNQAWQAIDKPSRLNGFHSRGEWLKAAEYSGLAAADTLEVFSTEHDSVIDMLASIKRVGANHKNNQSSRNSLGKRELADLDHQLRIKQVHTVPQQLLLDYKLMFVVLSHAREHTVPSGHQVPQQLTAV